MAQADRCRSVPVTRNETCVTDRPSPLPAAGQWNSATAPNTKPGCSSRACTRTSLAEWEHPRSSHPSHLAKSQNHPSAATASALSSTRLLRASHPEGLDWHVKKGIETMSRWTFAFRTCCCGQQEIPEARSGLGGVRVGPGARLPRLPALYKPKTKWRLTDQGDPEDYQEEELAGDPSWRKNYSSLAALANKVKDVLDDQSRRGQVLKLPELEARKQFPDLVVAALGANRKDKPNGIVSARVLFDGSNGIAVNRRTRIRDQERAPVAADYTSA